MRPSDAAPPATELDTEMGDLTVARALPAPHGRGAANNANQRDARSNTHDVPRRETASRGRGRLRRIAGGSGNAATPPANAVASAANLAVLGTHVAPAPTRSETGADADGRAVHAGTPRRGGARRISRQQPQPLEVKFSAAAQHKPQDWDRRKTTTQGSRTKAL